MDGACIRAWWGRSAMGDTVATRARRAALEGLVLGIKYGIVTLILGTLVLLVLGDYARVRLKSEQGAAAFAYLSRVKSAKPVASASPVP